MHPKLPPLPVRIVVALIVISAILYFGLGSLKAEDTGQLKASGTIESVTVNISPELAGKVKDVLVAEGQSVKTGDPLLSLDDSLLNAQRVVAVAQVDSAMAGEQTAQNALKTAESQYQITLETALAQGKSTRLADWFSDPNLFEQPGWYYTRAEQVESVQAQVEFARNELENAQADLAKVTQSLEQGDFLTAEKRLLDARLVYLIAQDVNYRAQNSTSSDIPKGVYNRTHCGTNKGYFVDNARLTNLIYKCAGDAQLAEAGQTLYKNARDELESAQKSYNDLLTSQAADEVLQARANVSVAQERYYSALDLLRNLRTGDQSTSVTVAQGGVDQARAGVDQAQKVVKQAQASLELLDSQIAKLIVYAPMDGVVLTRNVEPGEFVQPGAVALTLANLNDLTITVYVPEDRLNEIHPGQQATVTIDVSSSDSPTFTAEIIHMADEAEFTPRNVQTVEGRSSTVFAVKLKVTDTEGKLKIGMPADVVFK